MKKDCRVWIGQLCQFPCSTENCTLVIEPGPTECVVFDCQPLPPSTHNNGWMIAGATVGSLIAFVLLVLAGIFLKKKWDRRDESMIKRQHFLRF